MSDISHEFVRGAINAAYEEGYETGYKVATAPVSKASLSFITAVASGMFLVYELCISMMVIAERTPVQWDRMITVAAITALVCLISTIYYLTTRNRK